MDYLLIGIIGVLACTLGGVGYWYNTKRVLENRYKHVRNYLDETYQPRITSLNRFLINSTILRTVFPEYDIETCVAIFELLVARHRVKRDPIDGEWILTAEVNT